VVHHQSEDYNLAVALRQAVLSPWTIWPFHLVLALAGIPPLTLFVVDSISTLYQFWIHTELIGHLGWFERIFNTPAQHRVHHAVNPRYLDKNYAATLCIWDRLFGTFEEEKEQPVYGLVKPFGSFNPFWAQFHFFIELGQRSAAMRGLDRARVWLRGPDWGYPPAPEVDRAQQHKYDPRPSGRMTAWVAINLFAVVLATTALLWLQATMPVSKQLLIATLVLATLLGFGALLEKRRWALPLEASRLCAIAAAALVWVRL
jgi:alkylglycerol monooxygenase